MPIVLRALPQSARMYHAFGTTSVFEGHGVATELLNAYKEVHRAGNLTMRATLAISPDWKAASNADFGPLLEAWAGWLREPGLGDDWLKTSGLFAAVGRRPADDVRGASAPYTGWAGFNSDAGLPREQLKEVLLHCARNDIRVTAIAGAAGLGMLDLYDEVDRQVPLKGRRWVLAHVYVASPRDIERIARMGLVLTTHTNSSLYKALGALADRLPPERHDEITPMKCAARGRRDGLACNRQCTDLTLAAHPTDDRAKGLQITTSRGTDAKRSAARRRFAARLRMAHI